MKRLVSLAATFALSLPVIASADDRQIKIERVQGDAGNPPGVARAIVTTSGTPGGTVQIQIHEAADAAELARTNAEIQRKNAELQQKVAESQHNAQAQQEAVKRQLEVLVKQQHASHRDGLRDRVRRQRELTKQATKLLKKLDELDADESPKARELWAQLDKVQAELQQTIPQVFTCGLTNSAGVTFPNVPRGNTASVQAKLQPAIGAPQVHTFSIAPGQPAGAAVTTFNGGNFGGAGFGGAVSSGGIVSSGGVNSGSIVVSSQQGPAQTNPAAVHVRPLKVASPQNAAPQPSNADVLKALEAISTRIKMLEERVTKLSK